MRSGIITSWTSRVVIACQPTIIWANTSTMKAT
jgi:hypothetical protein